MSVRNNGAAASGATLPASPLLLRALHPVNLLSFGPDTPEIPLGPLNILIGPNGSGKSNFIEAIALLRSTSTRFADELRRGGGIQEWIWKGQPTPFTRTSPSTRITGEFTGQLTERRVFHSLSFTAVQQSHVLISEIINQPVTALSPEWWLPYFQHDDQSSQIRLGDQMKNLAPDTYDGNDSILAQRRDPEQYPEITHLAEQYNRIRIYREWAFGRNTVFREPQRADMRTDRLEEDFSNFGLFLNRLRRTPDAKNRILARLRDLYDGVDDFDVSIEGGTVQVFFTEGRFTIPATRLSDGTLRYLCLLAILCDPTPPPLICIEEPELGLHPDILPKIADLLVDASTRTQLIVTTHSDILVDAMTERPECVLMCEKREGQTHIERLNAEELALWTEKYRLGELWTRGELGGVRW